MGRTKAEAQATLDRVIRERFQEYQGDYTPMLVQCWGALLVVWREPRSGWCYRIFWPDQCPVSRPTNLTTIVLSGDTRDQCIANAMKHFVDACWEESFGDIPDWVPQEVRDEVRSMHEMRARAVLDAEARRAEDRSSPDGMTVTPARQRLRLV